jgi:hypothetical protein
MILEIQNNSQALEVDLYLAGEIHSSCGGVK